MIMKINQNTNLFKLNKFFGFEKSVAEGFGLAVLGKAVVYPFKFRRSLIFGTSIFMLLALAQPILAFGISISFARIVCLILATTLVFSCLANTIKNFVQGKTDNNFLPNFGNFALWDDVIHPFFLSLAVYFISFGLLIGLVSGAVWYAADAESKIETDKQKILSVVFPNSQTAIDENVETIKETFSQTAATVMRLSLVFSVPVFLALLWGIFYFPLACLIAGRTVSFIAILNPVIGFDTVRRLGWDFSKIILMFLILIVSALGLNAISQTIFSPFDSPVLGNLLVKAINSFFTFYLSIVFSVFLGLTLFKNSARLRFRTV